MSQTNSLDLLLKEINDPYVQENFYRLKLYLQRLQTGGTGGTTIINQGGGGNAVDSVWEKINKTAPAGSTIVADSNSLSSFRQLEYIINYRNTVTLREKGLKVTVVKDDTVINEQVYARTGAPLSVGLNMVINGGNVELQIENNELNAVNVSFAKLKIP